MELQGNIFGDWIPVTKIYEYEKANKLFYQKLKKEQLNFIKKKGSKNEKINKQSKK